MACALILLLAAAGSLPQESSSPATWDDAALWQDFCAFGAALEPLPLGETAISTDLYRQSLVDRGARDEQADALIERLHAYRRGSPERERIYWDARFKLGGGPDLPLPLLVQAIAGRPPGRALDAAMGRGRNAIYLAGVGWQVTGYDLSPQALAAAQRHAVEARVKLTTVEAAHENFAFGTEQWDLILCSYAYMQPHEEPWPGRLVPALRPGGLLVIQTSWKRQATLAELVERWQGLRIVRYEDLDAGAVTDDWGPSKEHPTVRLVLRKDEGVVGE